MKDNCCMTWKEMDKVLEMYNLPRLNQEKKNRKYKQTNHKY